jgi:hypothetical protein
MNSKIKVRCRTAPVGQFGALHLRYDQSIRILMLQVDASLTYPKGLNIDALMIFDMQEDGGVDAVEISQPLGDDLVTGYVFPRPRERYWRLFLEPEDKKYVERNAILRMERNDNVATLRFVEGTADSRYLIGPGVTALVGANNLYGISIDLTGLQRGGKSPYSGSIL